MPNQQGPRYATLTASSSSPSAAVLETLYAGRSTPLRQREVPRPSPRPLSSKDFGPEAIWGHYNNYRSNGLAGSVVFHLVVLALILGGATFTPKVVLQPKPHETVTLIAPSPDSYALPVAKTVVAGGGGGGDHDALPAPKGRLPKLAMQQITPPQIVLRNNHPKLAVEPTVVIPPQVHMAENHMPTLGNPSAALLPSAPPSNGT